MGWLSTRQKTPSSPSIPASVEVEIQPARPDPPRLAPPIRERDSGAAVVNTIGPGTTVRGDLKGLAGFRIDGQVDGSVESNGTVTIGSGGAVSGLVRGTNITIEGAVQGDVFATGHLEIGAQGRLIGDATAKSIRVADGGVFRGMSRTGDDPGEHASSPTLQIDAAAASRERIAVSDPPEEINVADLLTGTT